MLRRAPDTVSMSGLSRQHRNNENILKSFNWQQNDLAFWYMCTWWSNQFLLAVCCDLILVFHFLIHFFCLFHLFLHRATVNSWHLAIHHHLLPWEETKSSIPVKQFVFSYIKILKQFTGFTCCVYKTLFNKHQDLVEAINGVKEEYFGWLRRLEWVFCS